MVAKKQKLEAITIVRGTRVGDKGVARGAVLKVPGQISERDAAFLVGIGKARAGVHNIKAPAADKGKDGDK